MSAILALGVACGLAIFLLKSRANYRGLPEIPVVGGPAPADVTVIIPARNEERNIEAAVRSFPGLRVIVVDDASEDRTAELARAAGAEVIPAPPLARGVLGKPNACRAGARLAATPWLLFVDADTWYEPEFVSSAVSYARKESLDVMSCFLRQERRTWAERLLLPYSFALYFCGVNARKVNSVLSRQALANGQCLLVRREAYEFLGGHGAVQASVIEDVALAAIAKRHRMAVRVVRAERLGAVRMYDSLGAIWRGFTKNSFRFLQTNPWTGAQVIAASVLLTSYLPVLLLLAVDHHWIPAALFALLPSALLAGWYRDAGPALAAPIAIYVFQLIALDGMFRVLLGRKAIWKGRRV